MSGIIGTIFGISQDKIKDDSIVNVLLVVGTIGFMLIGILINLEEKKRNKLIDILEKTQKD